MAKFGHGIFKSPYAQDPGPPLASSPPPLPSLPPKDVADALLRQYRYTIHPTLPIVNWRVFQEQYQGMYRDGSLHNTSSVWNSLLFAVFACGTLHRSWFEGQKYLEVSKSFIDLWTDDLTLEHARVALLNCMFLVESNRKSAGWNWMGIAIRISFDIGLNCEAGIWDPIEEEMRRRVFWSIYACDWYAKSHDTRSIADVSSLLSLELGRPSMIQEEDCDVQMPSPASDEIIYEGSNWTSPAPEVATSALLPTIRVIGPIARLLKMLKSPQISPATLRLYDTHLETVMNSLPTQQHTHTNNYIDPIELVPSLYLQNARLVLHRHNITPMCEQQTRSQALDHCAVVAKETARLLQRCLQSPPTKSLSNITNQQDSWEMRMLSASSAFMCTHIWRCTLFLLLRLDFESALTCARSSRVLGDSRAVNTACGRYLDFFLCQFIHKSKRTTSFDLDEELVAYVSGDLQGNFGSAWIWQTGRGDVHLGKPYQSAPEQWISQAPTRYGNAETNGVNGSDWAGWDKIIKLIEGLATEQKHDLNAQRPLRPEVRTPAFQLPPLAASPSPSATTPRDRLSIKDLL